MRPPSEEEIIVDTFDISGKTFLTFSILNNELIASQSAGTNGTFSLTQPFSTSLVLTSQSTNKRISYLASSTKDHNLRAYPL